MRRTQSLSRNVSHSAAPRLEREHHAGVYTVPRGWDGGRSMKHAPKLATSSERRQVDRVATLRTVQRDERNAIAHHVADVRELLGLHAGHRSSLGARGSDVISVLVDGFVSCG